MATVIQESFRPAPKNDPLFALLLQQSIKRRGEEEDDERKVEAAGRAAQALTGMLSLQQPGTAGLPEQPGRSKLDPKLVEQFLTSSVEAGGKPASAARTIMAISQARTKAEKDAAANQAMIELGQQFKDSPDPRQKFAGTVFTIPDIDPTTKTAILNQTKVLFPEAKDAKLKSIKVFSPDGEEDVIRIPADVQNPQEYMEKNFPDLVAAGFTTRKPKGEKEKAPTEGDKNVAAVVQSSSTLQRLLSQGKIKPQEARNRARLMLRERKGVVRQLEADFGRSIEGGAVNFDTIREQTLFELARGNVSAIFAGGITEPGTVVKVAKEVALEQFENLRFLPPQLELTPENAKSMEHLQAVIEFLMNTDQDFLGKKFAGKEDRFEEALRLLNRRVKMSDEAVETLRERVLGKPDDESEEEPGALSKIFNQMFSQ